MRAPQIYLVAGEPSGDALGAELMQALRAAEPNVQLAGVGGDEMLLRGLTSLFPMADISVMGFGPVVKRLPVILDRIKRVVTDIRSRKPDVVVLIDSQEFSRTVAARLKKGGFDGKIVQYVSPTVWAWRPGRARKLAECVDRVLAFLPFEPEAMRSLQGPETVYVGHPLLNLVPEGLVLREPPADPTVLLLPGSRNGELERLLDVFGETVAVLASQRPGVRFVLPAVGHLEARLRTVTGKWAAPVEIISGLSQMQRLKLFSTAHAALATSGTVTLELALCGCPTVVTYKVSPVIWSFRFMLKAPFISLPNLILGRELLPERLQERATPQTLASEVRTLLEDPEARARQWQGLAELRQRMALKDNRRPQEAAAEAVLDLV